MSHSPGFEQTAQQVLTRLRPANLRPLTDWMDVEQTFADRIADDRMGAARMDAAGGCPGGWAWLPRTDAIPGLAQSHAELRVAQRADGLTDAEAIAYLRGLTCGYAHRKAAVLVEWPHHPPGARAEHGAGTHRRDRPGHQ